MTTEIITVVLCCGILLGALFLHILHKVFDPAVMEDFQKKFPGRCPICSFHRYGLSSGYINPGEPVPRHIKCPEGVVFETSIMKSAPEEKTDE